MRAKANLTTERRHDALDLDIDWTPDPTDPDLSPQAVAQLLSRICDPFPDHVELAAMFTAAGFNVIRVEKLWCAHVWDISMERGTTELPREYRPAARHLRRLLEQHRIPVDRVTPALRLNGNRLTISFRWAEGKVGAIIRRRGGGWNTLQTPNCEADPEAVPIQL
jgi:hypothetical protein